MKKQAILAIVLLLLIPVVLKLGAWVFSLINPEIAAGHPNYVRNYHLLSVAKHTSTFASAVLVLILCVFNM